MGPELIVGLGLGFIGSSLASFAGVLWSRRPLIAKGWGIYFKSLCSEPSRCDSCGAPVKPWALVPVLGFLLTRGRCRSCSIKIPISFFFAELVAFLLIFIVVIRHFQL